MNTDRIVFIDILRGWAGLAMIEVHVVNAFLWMEFRSAGWFPFLDFINGLVAPAFLFVAGLVFVIAAERKADQFRLYGDVFRKQLEKIGLIWVFGYLLHLPFVSLRRVLSETSPEGWLRFFQVDILHCIAAGLLAMFFLRIIVKGDRSFERVLWICAAAAVAGAPFLWKVDFNRFLHPMAGAYFNSLHYSEFPLFPWVGFLFLGGVVGLKYLKAKRESAERMFARSLAMWGSGAVLAALLVGNGPALPGVSEGILHQPGFFVLRAGCVLFFLAGCWAYERMRSITRGVVVDVSRQTLLVYVAHLLIIYGTFWNGRSLAGIYGQSLSLWATAGAAAALLFIMIVSARGWGVITSRSLMMARNIKLVGGIAAVLFFLVN